MFVKSKILRSTHAFSTRESGVSILEHTKSLNLAFGRGDEDGVVLQNLEIFAQTVGFDAKSVVSLPQIHSDTIYRVTKADAGEGYYKRDKIREGDGYITDDREVTLGVKGADCTPILFEAEKDGKIIAVGAVHAGWRGTVAGIAPKCVKMLCREYGVLPKDIRAAVGPCIHKCCYEVGEEVRAEVASLAGKEYAYAFVTPSDKVDGKFYCDLPAINRALLLDAGILPENVEILDECTCCNPKKYFSHRFSRGVRGTMLSVIKIE